MAPIKLASGKAPADPGQNRTSSPSSKSATTKATTPPSTDTNISPAPTLVPTAAAPTTSNARRETWDGRELVTVASLPLDTALSGTYYLRFGEWFTAPRAKLPKVKPSKAPSATNKKKKKKTPLQRKLGLIHEKGKYDDSLKATAAWCFRHCRCSIRTLMAKVDWRPAYTERCIFQDVAGSSARLTLQHGIGRKEVEHAIVGGYNWTRDWDCVLSLRQKSHMHGFKTTCAFYFKDLPARLIESVPWRDGNWTRQARERIYKCTTCICCGNREWICETSFIERGDDPRWAAVIAVEHMTRMESLEHYPLDIVDTSMCELAEMDIRTGLGRYRKAMWYRYKKGYGNDLARQPMDQWREALVVELEDFFSVIFRN